MLTVQGELSDANGDLVNGVNEFEIKIYSNGVTEWRTVYKVGVNNGAFSIQLGSAGQSALAYKKGTNGHGVSDQLTAADVLLTEKMFFGTTSASSVEIGVAVKNNAGVFEEIKRYGLGVALFSLRAASIGDGAADYDWSFSYTDGNSGPNRAADGGASQIQMTDSGANQQLTTVAGMGLAGTVGLFNPSGTTIHKLLQYNLTYSNGGLSNFVSLSVGSAQYQATTAVNGIRFLMSSGTIASGTFRLYGIK